ncbi:trypsin-like cysteine/serine peptidase domain-containing protein [Coemansia spiralis]|nr:trypsin-like cysteine/serine peptidase domain-containing protein [Coemansia spiralis]
MMPAPALALLLLAVCSASPVDEQQQQLDKRIVGGTQVATNKYPFAVHLLMTLGMEQYMCGGALIDAAYVVTAAHCTVNTNTNSVADATQMSVCYGSNSLSKQQCTTARQIYVHPDYNSETLTNDIAVIQISPLTLGKSVNTVNIYTGKLPEKTQLTTMGWGLTQSNNSNSIPDMLMSVDIEVGDSGVCATSTPNYRSADGPEVCAQNNLTPGKDSCEGDSGSPTILANNGTTAQLVAVTSSGYNMDNPGSAACGEKDGLGFYTHVYYYIDFITSATKLSASELTSDSGSSSGSEPQASTSSAASSPVGLPPLLLCAAWLAASVFSF